MAPNQSICAFPWNSIAVRPNGDAVPCCKFKSYLTNQRWGNVQDSDFRNNALWTDLRQRMLQGESINECLNCYQEESSGAESMRILSLQEFVPEHNQIKPITLLEMSFSNLCNLACVSCNSYCSSKWGTEDYKHKRSRFTQVMLEHKDDLVGQDLSQITTLKIIGGEPFMEQRRFISLMRRMNLTNLELWISTNGTVLPNQELQELISQCRRVNVHLSLDGIGSVAEWYRWPTKFTDVEATMRQMESWWADNPNIYLYTKTLVNVYNVWTLDHLVNYIRTEFPNWEMYFDWIYNPAWQSVNILPAELKQTLDTKLQNWLTVKGNWNAKFGNPFAITRDRLQDPTQVTVEEFKQRTLTLAQERNLDVVAMVPEISCLIN